MSQTSQRIMHIAQDEVRRLGKLLDGMQILGRYRAAELQYNSIRSLVARGSKLDPTVEFGD